MTESAEANAIQLVRRPSNLPRVVLLWYDRFDAQGTCVERYDTVTAAREDIRHAYADSEHAAKVDGDEPYYQTWAIGVWEKGGYQITAYQRWNGDPKSWRRLIEGEFDFDYDVVWQPDPGNHPWGKFVLHQVN